MTKEQKRNFVAHTIDGRRILVRLPKDLTETQKNYYTALVGPFRTRRAALYMLKHGENNPHCRTVADAEKLSKQTARKKANMQKFLTGLRKLMQQCGIEEINVWPATGAGAGYDKDGNGVFSFNSIKVLGDDNVREYDLI